MRLLILGGTAEARQLADRAPARAGLHVITSLAGRTRAPRQPAGEVRVGGFGGIDGLARYLGEARIDLLIDASHPFARQISRHAATAAARLDLPLLSLLRPAWQARQGDRWTEVASGAAAAARLPEFGRRAFLSLGRQALAPFSGVAGVWFLVRAVDPPSEPLPLGDHEVVVGRGPFSVTAERALMAEHRIDCLVSRNSGGDATYAKIAAARQLDLPVLMIGRPAPPDGETVTGVDDALAWLSARQPR